MMNKRGQFYLVAAIIVIAITFSLFSARNYAQRESVDTIVPYVASELKFEGARVIDYGTVNPPADEIVNFIDTISTQYVGEKAQDITFIYGNSERAGSQTIVKYVERDAGTVDVNGVSVSITNKVEEPIKPEYIKNTADGVSLTINDAVYDFKLNKGEYFYVILEKETGDNKYVSQE